MVRLFAKGEGGNVATEGDGKTESSRKKNLQIVPLSTRSRFFRDLPFRAEIRQTVRALIGGPLFLHLDQVFMKPARDGAGTQWHQDNAYFKISDPARGTGMWIALDDANLKNGTMQIIPGSHLNALLPHVRDMGSNHHICCQPDESRALPVAIPRGGCVFFNYGILHCTKENRSNHERAGLALHFVNGHYLPHTDRFLRIPLENSEKHALNLI